MGAAYSVGSIRYDQVDRAYCLIEAVGYDVDLERWREFCSSAIAKAQDPNCETVVTVENPLGYVTAVGILRARISELYGRVLDVPVFVVVSAADTPGVCDALLGFVMATAGEKHCGFVRVASPEPASWSGLPGRGQGESKRGILIAVR